MLFVIPPLFAASASCATSAGEDTPSVAVAPKSDTNHVYVASKDVDRFAASFLATFGNPSSKQVVSTVTPTPSLTTSQPLRTVETSEAMILAVLPAGHSAAAARSISAATSW